MSDAIEAFARVRIDALLKDAGWNLMCKTIPNPARSGLATVVVHDSCGRAPAEQTVK